jgi:hypothetical protein
VVVPGGSTTLMDGTIAYSQYKISLQEADEKERSSLINGFNMGLNFTYFFRKDEVKYGLEVLGFKPILLIIIIPIKNGSRKKNTTEFGAYLRYKKSSRKFSARFRVSGFIIMHRCQSLSFEPRLGAKYNVSDKFRLKAAAGLYSQI